MKLLSLLICAICYQTAIAQNLVPNPGFEDTIKCPDFEAQLHNTKFWFSPLYHNSTDFFHSCDYSNNVGISKNKFGYQFANNGDAYIGFAFYSARISNYREYVGVRLKTKLISNVKYRIRFWISLSNESKFAISNFDVGVYFSQDSLGMPQVYRTPLSVSPVNVGSKSILKDTCNWIEVSLIYKAIGAEEYMYIGNFNNDIVTYYKRVNDRALYDVAYYYIDDVSVIKVPDKDISLDSISVSSNCYNEPSFLDLHFSNAGLQVFDFTQDTVVFSVEVKKNGVLVQNFDMELNNNTGNPQRNFPLAVDSTMSVKIGPIDLSGYGSDYKITLSSFSVRDSNKLNDTLVFNFVPDRREECFPLEIPNIFTPNGDGINDFFMIGNSEGKNLQVIIYNRWGQEVASFMGNEAWDGGELPEGVYYYQISEEKGGSLKTHKGSITIFR